MTDAGMPAASWLLFRGPDVLVRSDSLAFPDRDFEPANAGLTIDAWYPVSVGSEQTARVAQLPEDAQAPHGYQFTSLRSLLVRVDADRFTLAGTAAQVLEWARSHRFCSRCGTSTQPHPKGERATVCPSCAYHQYPRINPCVIVAITREDTILLARAQRYARPMYSLLAGFVEAGETLEQAVHREVAEEAGIQVRGLRYFGSQPWPFPNNLMLAFQAEWDRGDLVIQEEELMDAQFFRFDALPEIPPPGSIAYRLIQAAVTELAARYS